MPEVFRPICLFAIFMQHSDQILFSASKLVRYCLIVQIGPRREKKWLFTDNRGTNLPTYLIQLQYWILSSFMLFFFYMNTVFTLIMRNTTGTVGNTQTERGFFLDGCDLGRWVCSQSKHSSLSCKFCENSPQEDRHVLQLIRCSCNSCPSKEWRPSGFSLSFFLRTTWGSAV